MDVCLSSGRASRKRGRGRTGDRSRQRRHHRRHRHARCRVSRSSITGDRGEKVAVTEADGSYRFALLVPGSYVIKAELEGMGTADERCR